MGEALAVDRAALRAEEQRRREFEAVAEALEKRVDELEVDADDRDALLEADRRKYPVQDLRNRVAELEAEAEELRRRVAEQAAQPDRELDPQAAALASLESKLDSLQEGWGAEAGDHGASSKLSEEERILPFAAIGRLKVDLSTARGTISKLQEVVDTLRAEVAEGHLSPKKERARGVRMDLLDLEGRYWELQQEHVTLQREAATLREERELSRMAQEDAEQHCLARAERHEGAALAFEDLAARAHAGATAALEAQERTQMR